MDTENKRRTKCNICEGTFPSALKVNNDERCPACVFLLLAPKDKITKTIPTSPRDRDTQMGRRIVRKKQGIFYYASEVILSNEKKLWEAYSREPEFFLESDRNILEYKVLNEELRQEIDEALTKLTVRQETVLKLRFGLDGIGEKTLDEIAKIMKTSKETVRQHEGAGIKQLKHPRINRKLKELISPSPTYTERMRVAEKEQREYEWRKAKRKREETHRNEYSPSRFMRREEEIYGSTNITNIQKCVILMMGG